MTITKSIGTFPFSKSKTKYSEGNFENCSLCYFAKVLIIQISHVLVRCKVIPTILWHNRTFWITTWKGDANSVEDSAIEFGQPEEKSISKMQGKSLNRQRNMFSLEESHCNQSNYWTEKNVAQPWFGREQSWTSPTVYGDHDCMKQSISTKSMSCWKMRSFSISRWFWLPPT